MCLQYFDKAYASSNAEDASTYVGVHELCHLTSPTPCDVGQHRTCLAQKTAESYNLIKVLHAHFLHVLMLMLLLLRWRRCVAAPPCRMCSGSGWACCCCSGCSFLECIIHMITVNHASTRHSSRTVYPVANGWFVLLLLSAYPAFTVHSVPMPCSGPPPYPLCLSP